MQLIGTVARLQVQQSSLKVGQHPRRYDPWPLREVPLLTITPAGVFGPEVDGIPLVDVHNAEHLQSKNRDGANGVSLGFTGHYAAMRRRFGPHLGDGIAGENILVATDGQLAPEVLAPGLVVATRDGARLELDGVVVAAPCVEFSRYALRFPDDALPDRSVTEALRFLHQGMRGYYASYAGPPATIRPGDQVFVRSA